MTIPGARIPGHPVEALLRSGPAGDLADDRLVGRFLAGDSAAFEVLVRRHGPLVDRTCRAILRDRHEAEDAFQATFLVLARRAGSVRRRDSLAPWLRGVARRVAVRLKRRGERRGQLDRGIARDAITDPESGCGRAEVIAAVREEVERLPARSRLPVVLCDLEGMSYQEAAEALGVSPDTVRGRLARARARLRHRLASRGLAPDGTLPALLLTARAPRIGASLIDATVRSALQVAAGRAIVAGPVPASVITLSEEVIQAMRFPVVRSIGGVALSGVLAVAGAFVCAQGSRPAAPAPASPPQAKQSPAEADLERLQGTWVGVATMSGGISRLLPEDQRNQLQVSGSDFIFNKSPEAARLDPTQRPKAIDLTPTGETAGPLRGKAYFGIYEVEGDMLMLCLDIYHQSERPLEFATKPGSRVLIDLYKRTKR